MFTVQEVSLVLKLPVDVLGADKTQQAYALLVKDLAARLMQRFSEDLLEEDFDTEAEAGIKACGIVRELLPHEGLDVDIKISGDGDMLVLVHRPQPDRTLN